MRGDIALVSVRAGDEERVASLDCVAEFQLSRPVKTDMDLSRQMSGVESIHNGVDLDHPYTGSGVIAAVVELCVCWCGRETASVTAAFQCPAETLCL